MVSVELALALPVAIAALLLCLSALRVTVDQIRCVDAARVAARSAARGDPPARTAELARQVGPPGLRVDVNRHGGLVEVQVSAPAGQGGGSWTAWLGRFEVSARSVATDENTDPVGLAPAAVGPPAATPGRSPGIQSPTRHTEVLT